MEQVRPDRRPPMAWPVVVGIAMVTAVGVVNAVIRPPLVLYGAFAVGPCLAGVGASAVAVAATGAYALLLAAQVSWTHGIWGTQEQAFYLVVIAAVTAISMVVAHRLRRLQAQAEQSRADRDALAAVVENSDDAIVVQTLDGTVRAWNQGAERLYGYPAAETLGRHASMIMSETETDGLPQLLEQVAHGHHVDPYEVKRITKDGGVLDVSVSLTPVRDHRGVVVAASAIERDITARKRTEALARQIQQRTAHSERLESLGHLAGGIAHDFNNILAIVLNYAEFLTEAVDGNLEATADLEHIKKAAGRAQHLVRQLLVFARREPARTEELDLATVITTTRDLLAHTIGENIDLLGTIGPEPLPIRADRGQIEQVLVNIVLNARDAMPDGGAVIIEAEAVDLDPSRDNPPPALTAGRYARLQVSDTGRGMSSDVAARVFEPFFTTKPKDKGVGLGLATAYGIVSQAGGAITIRSQLDVGTTVTVYLPLVEQTATPGAPTDSDPAPHGRGEHLLVAEDEDALRSLIVRLLERHGYAVQAADRGPRALELARERPPQLLLTDMIMPEMSGQELVERLRRRHPHLPVVVMTGYSAGLLNRGQLAETNTQLIRKPFTSDELLQAVHRALHRASAGPRP